jgi:ANTAR domain/GAF domain
MVKDGVRGLSAASNKATERLEELQITMGEGPCIEAFNRRRPVLVPQFANGAMQRWPGYAPAAYASGVRAVFSFPLQIGAARLGMMDVFRGQEGVLSKQELGIAITFAEVAVATLLDGKYRDQGADGDGFGDLLGPRTEVFQAQGMVMMQLGVPIADALAVIRAHAYAHNRRLSDVAADIVARRLGFEPEQ